MKLMLRVADALYAAFRAPRDTDSGPCDYCGEHVEPFQGERTAIGMYCSDLCSSYAFEAQH